MKKYLSFLLILGVLTVSQASASTLDLTALPVTTANGYYVGIGGNLNGGTAANYYSSDFAGTSSTPSPFTALVSTLSNISGAKFASQADALKKYQQVGWLMYEMEVNPTKVAAIQFAMWSVFNPSTLTFQDSAAWLDASTKIDASGYDFGKMRIYTPVVSSTQKSAGRSMMMAVVPEPAEWVLLIVGLVMITYSLYRKRSKGVILIRG